MCFQRIPVIYTRRRPYHHTNQRRNLSNLQPLQPNTDTTNSFTVGLWNCQSAVKKADFISAYATSLSVDLLALTETWLRPHNTTTPAAFSSNHSFSHTTRPKKRGGGTGILINKLWIYAPLLPINNYTSFEYHAIKVTAPIKVSVLVVYRPPGPLGDFVDELDTLISSIPDLGCPLLILGDFNIHLDKPYATDFKALMNSFDFQLASCPPTHKNGNQLDLILTKDCQANDIKVTPMHVSDHFFIHFTTSLPELTPSPPPLVTYRRNLRNLPPTSFASAVATVLPPASKLSSLDVDTATDSLTSTLTSCLNNLCPLVTKPARPSQPRPWLTETVRALRTTLRAAERKWRKTRSPSDLEKLRSLLASFNTSVTTAKMTYYNDKISNTTDSRKLFSTFKSLLNPPPPPATTDLNPDNFATFFTEKVANISKQFCEPPSPPQNIPTAATLHEFTPLSEEDVSKFITTSRPTTCLLDPVPTNLLQDIAPTVVPAITSILNSSLSSGTVPSAFKQARVTPLLKKPTLNPAQVENYRPVSLLPFLSKTLERSVAKQVTNFLNQNGLLDPKQSGFRSGHSTETALLSVTEALKTARTQGLSSVLILLDLSAAFDTVNHKILLKILTTMGITGVVHSWFNSYLSGRTFSVSWQGKLSSTHTLSTGVPQGSVLGPLLFAMYTSSLGRVIQTHGLSYHCYADDTQMYLSFDPKTTTDSMVSARISACLTDLSTWMKDHHLQLNLSKTELLVIPEKESICHNINLKMGSATVTPNKVAKNLGIMIDDELSFSNQIHSVARTSRFQMSNIWKFRPFLTQYATQRLVQATIMPRIDYCNSLMAGLPACALKPLQMVQNAAARLVFKQPKRTHVTPLFVELHWLPIAARIKHKALTLAYKTTAGTAPGYLKDILKPYVSGRELRSSNTGRLALPHARSKRSQSRLFSVIVPQWWNGLPEVARLGTTLSAFKKQVKTFLFRDYLLH